MASLATYARRPSLFDPAPAPVKRTAGRTLEDLVSSSWGALCITGASACILCGGEVAARYGSGPHPVGGKCRSCGTEVA
jgi:hypothetical protein